MRAPYLQMLAAGCLAAGVKPDAAQYEKGFQDGRWDAEHRFK